MDSNASHSVPAAERSLPAWLFSFVFHVTTITLLGLTVSDAPRGAADESGRSAGIVLKPTSAEGDLYEGEEGLTDRLEISEPASPSDIASSLPSESAADDAGRDLPKLPTPGPDTTTGPGATAGGSQPNAIHLASDGGRRGSPAGGGSARVSVFGVEGNGNKFLYVFDRSSSMEGPPLAAAKRQLIESLDSLETVHQFHIVFFNHKLQAFDITGGGRRIAFATDRNKQLAANFVGGIVADGGTDRYTALKAALGFTPDVIFFLTDADDPMSASELYEIERDAQRSGTAICVIEFGRNAETPKDNFLQALARKCSGQYGYVNTASLAR
jgi:hypothetical protein